MAFRQPTAAPHRLTISREQEQTQTQPQTEANPPSLSRGIDESQEWILFSPTHAGQSVTASTEQATQTTTRLSDFGSLNTLPRSGIEEDELSDVLEDADELDSLDDNLHTFREPPLQPSPSQRRLDQSGGSILPTHDGLGTFPPATSPAVQEQIWSHERYNPRRRPSLHRRTLSSVQRKLDAIEDEVEEEPAASSYMDSNRMERIEKWRLDQSKILLEEFHKEKGKDKPGRSATTRSGVARTGSTKSPVAQPGWPEAAENHSDEASIAPLQDNESVWQRITRRVIHDLIGIDDELLSVILGEALVEDSDLSKTPTQASTMPSRPLGPREGDDHDSWEDRLIRRLARELGNLIEQLSGGSLPRPATVPAMEYAGIPINYKFSAEGSGGRTETSKRDDTQESAQFLPTLDMQDPKNTGIHSGAVGADGDLQASTAAEAEYWERTPDLKSMFAYLSRRFISGRQSRPQDTTTSSIATTNTPHSLRRTAIIRQHHPLVPRPRNSTNERPATRGRRASLRSSTHQIGLRSPAIPAPASLKRAGTSCASWSTKRNKLDSDCGSRNYWDIGASIGSESIALGGVGNWGEV